MVKKRVVHKNIVLLIIAIAQFMVVLDTSIVNVALPSIYEGLRYTSESNLQWVVTAYTLAFGGFLLLGGRAADLYGRRKVFMIAAGFFTFMSLICGLAQNSIMLDASRALQGLAAAFMSPAALSIIITTFKEGKERAKALSVWGAVAAGGAAAGLLFGGILTEYLDWRWNFFVNIPVGIGVVIASYLYVPESKAGLDHKKLDLPGAVTVTAGLISVVYAITQAPTKGWGSTETLSFLFTGIVLLAFFIWNEKRSNHALMPLNIFKVGNIAAANLAQFPMMAAMFSMFFFVSIYLQNILGYTPIQTGLSFLPITFVIGIMSAVMSKVVGKIGYKKPLVVGPLFVAVALFYLSNISVGGNYLSDVFPGLILMAVGMGMVFISVTIAATAGVPHNKAGLASGILNTSQQLGGALGLAILSGVSAAGVKSYMATNSGVDQAVAHATVNGFSNALVIAAFFPLITSVVALAFVKMYHVDEEAVIAAA